MTTCPLVRSFFVGMMFCGVFGLASATAEESTPPQESPKLSPAQKLVFGTRHLQNISSPTTLTYHINGHSLNGVNFDNSATLEVFKFWPNGSRGTEAVFPTEEGPKSYVRSQFCCNPIILYFLEWNTQRTFYETGISRFYIRTQLRNAFFDAEVKDTNVVFNGKKTKAKVVVLKPFADSEGARLASRLASREYQLVLADDVPGMLLSIKIMTPADKEKDFASEKVELTFKSQRG